jgi:hypothetical protein
MDEIWKTVPEWDMYEVSNLGRIRRKAGLYADGRWWRARIKKPKKGYIVVLCDKPRRLDTALARVILTTFIGPPPNPDDHARHLDDIKSHNQLLNLAWGTPKQNCEDKIRNGRTTKGRPRPLHVRIKIGLGNKGKILSFETKQKISNAKRGKKLTLEHKRKIGLSSMGRIPTRSALHKRSISMKRFWERKRNGIQK